MKKITPIFEAHVVDGKMKMLDHVRRGISRWVSTFKPGTRIDIVIRKHGEKRTNDQNAYYWGVVIPILADHFGYDHEDMHHELKELFNPIESKIQPGKKIGGTTTKMSTEEIFCGETSYVERICRWASMEYQIYIPPPKKVDP